MTKTTDEKVPRLNLSGLSAPQATATRVLLGGRLRGHVGNGAWLAPDLDAELDDLREEHHRLLRAVNDAGDLARALDAKWKAEDRAHDEALKEAHRMGLDAPPDGRSPAPDRDAERDRALEAVWAGLHVLGEHADRVVAFLRANEDRLLGKLRSQLSDAADQRREASNLAATAKAQEWRVHRMGQWLQACADDGPGFGQQPAPVVEDAPVGWAMPENSLKRHWTKVRPWTDHAPDGDGDEPAQRARQSREPADPDDGLILPLDDRTAA